MAVGIIVDIFACVAVVCAFLIVLSGVIIMQKRIRFVSALSAAIAATGVGFLINSLKAALVASGLSTQTVQIAAAAAASVIISFIYSAILRTNDGVVPDFMQAFLIYLVEVAILIAMFAAIAFGFHLHVPGLPQGLISR